MATINYTFGDDGTSIGYTTPSIGYLDNGTLKKESLTQGTADTGSISADDNTIICIVSDKSAGRVSATGATLETVYNGGYDDDDGDGCVLALLPTSDTVALTF